VHSNQAKLADAFLECRGGLPTPVLQLQQVAVLVKTFKHVLLRCCCTSALQDGQDYSLEYKEASCILELGPAVGWFARGSRNGPGTGFRAQQTETHNTCAQRLLNFILKHLSIHLELHVFFGRQSDLCLGTPPLYLTT